MLSLVAGYSLEVAKRLTPILARVPRRNRGGGGATSEDWLATLAAINDDLDQYQAGSTTTATAIVLMAIYWPLTLFIVDGTDNSPVIAKGWAGILNSMVGKGAMLVTGSGNQGGAVDGFPSGFGSQPPINNWPYIPSLLVAGAVIPNTGAVSSTTTTGNNVPNIWAPGEAITVANGNKAGWTNSDGSINPSGAYNVEGSKGTSDGVWTRPKANFPFLADTDMP